MNKKKNKLLLPHRSWEESLQLVDKEQMVYPKQQSKI